MGDEDRKAFLSRIGTFFLLLGLLCLVLFVASDLGQETYFSYFFIGVILLIISWYFKRISATEPAKSNRFTWIRSVQQKQRDAKNKKPGDKKEEKKDDKKKK